MHLITDVKVTTPDLVKEIRGNLFVIFLCLPEDILAFMQYELDCEKAILCSM